MCNLKVTQQLIRCISILLVYLIFISCEEETPTNQVVNQSPEILNIVLSADTINTDTKVKVFSSAIDPDGDSLTYNWNAQIGSIQGSGNTIYWNILVDTNGVFQITLIVTDIFGASDTNSVDLVVNLPNYTVYGWISGNTPKGIYPIENAIVSIPSAISTSQYTNPIGGFVAQFVDIPSYFSVEVDHSEYQTIDTLFYKSDLESDDAYTYQGIKLMMNKYVNYIPLSVGNEWRYDSKYSKSDYFSSNDYKIEGQEKWLIKDIEPDSSSFTIEIAFEGYTIYFGNTYLENDTNITINTTTLNIIRDGESWLTESEYNQCPGTRIISNSLPYLFPYQKEGYSESYEYEDNYGNSEELNMIAKYRVGLLSFYRHISYPEVGYSYTLTLIDYNVQ